MGLNNIVHFTDDGISGLRFDRPGFVSLINEVDAEIILPPVYSSAAGKSHRKEPDPWIRKSDFLLIWAKEPDAFTPADVQRMTGYTGSTVRQWIKKRKLRAVTVQGRSLVAKEWLAEFMAGDGMRIANKSGGHWRMLKKIGRME